MQAVSRRVTPKLRVARLEQIERSVRGDPEVLRLVGAGADDRRLQNALVPSVDDVLDRPGARTSELNPSVRGAAVWIAGVRIAATVGNTAVRPRLDAGRIFFSRMRGTASPKCDHGSKGRK